MRLLVHEPPLDGEDEVGVDCSPDRRPIQLGGSPLDRSVDDDFDGNGGVEGRDARNSDSNDQALLVFGKLLRRRSSHSKIGCDWISSTSIAVTFGSI